ncbi:tyrosine-protein phosphatase [Streptomyces halobius]|uniref:Tyrosine-protein phosphatase n=1 Tax=Streptomyces halobius TaxID=2879846 RepID=A0ABY4MJZ8_9ACTN|nr:tyrosine-protein phosphatase [Streptomyces halobius]UQA98166.1 tyrosine-protein phosphatase [Streptomyces halobius]
MAGYGHAPADVMRRFLAALAQQHGCVRDDTRDLLGVDDDLVAALRRNLLEPAPGCEPAFRLAMEQDLPTLGPPA